MLLMMWITLGLWFAYAAGAWIYHLGKKTGEMQVRNRAIEIRKEKIKASKDFAKSYNHKVR